jgi:hypothetical protein
MGDNEKFSCLWPIGKGGLSEESKTNLFPLAHFLDEKEN